MPTSISHFSHFCSSSLPLSLSAPFSDPSMSLSVHPDLFLLPFEELVGEDEDPETLPPSESADPLPDRGGDDFFFGRRSYASGSNQLSRARHIVQEGLRIVGSDSETDTNEQIVAIGDTSFRWECLLVDENRRDPTEDFEWEDVEDRAGEREILSLTAFFGDDEGNPSFTEEEEELDLERRNFDWEVLLAVNNMGARYDADSFQGEDQEGFDYTSEFEVLFDQFVDHSGAEWTKCGFPAAKSVVESLPSVLLTAEDVAKNNTICAICNDDISLTVKVKRLPCLHHYHEYCILPWLTRRNTCPLCRYVLPAGDASEEEAQARYDFVILQDS